MNKKRKIGKRIVALFTCLTMVLCFVELPGFTMTAQAVEESVEAQAPSVTAFATKADLVDPDNFTLHTDNGTGVAQKVNFGSDKTWYIAGEDKDGTLVLMCDSNNRFAYMTFLESAKYDSVSFRNSAEFKGLKVYISHYGISDVRDYLNKEALNSFKEKEKELITNPVIYTDDIRNRCTYTTSDKLYLAYGEYSGNNTTYVTVGKNSSDNLNNGIKVGVNSNNISEGSPYSLVSKKFFLRSPYNNTQSQEYVMVSGGGYNTLGYTSVGNRFVVPALNLDLASVLFASTATVALSDATLSDAMTFRMNGEEVIKSKVERSYDSVKVTKGEASDEYIYIQYNDGETDKVISEKITADKSFSSRELGLYTFRNCKIWIEKYDEETNLTYAVMEEGPNFIVDNKLIYKISEGTNGLEAELVGPSDLSGKVVVKGEIDFDGQTIPVTTMTDALFRENTNITELDLSESKITDFGFNAFAGCTSLKVIKLPNDLPKITDINTFAQCPLEYVNIPTAWDSIYMKLFANRTVKQIEIPSSVKKIDKNVFLNCTGLESVIYTGTEKQWKALIDTYCGEGSGNEILADSSLFITYTHVHFGGIATCTKKAVCEDCGEEYGELADHNFSDQLYHATDDKSQHYQECKDCGEKSTPVAHSETEIKNQKAATCTEKGYTGDKCCKDCGIIIEAGTEVNAKGHTEEIIPAKEATCKETGLTEGKKCSVCGTVTVAQTEVKKLEHTWDEGKVTKEPTKDADGVKTFTCTKCGETKTEAIDKLPDNIDPTPGPDPTPAPTPSPEPVKPLVPEISVKGKFDVAAAVATVSDKKPVAYAITSSDKKAGKITKAGILTAKKAGEVEITAYSDKKKTDEITKVKLVIKSTKVPAKDSISYMDDICDLKSKITDMPLGVDVKFSISEKQQKYATVDAKTGIITPVKDGKVKVTVEIGEGNNAAKFYTTVTIKTPQINPAKAVVIAKDKAKAISLKNVKSSDKIEWSVSDTTKAEIIKTTKDSKIKVKGLEAGKVTLTADANGHKISKEIEITE